MPFRNNNQRKLQSLISNIGGGLRDFFAANDGHGDGSIRTLYNCSKYFAGLLSCLAEIKDNLGTEKLEKLFQISVILIEPRLDEEDHDSSNVISFFTGILIRPFFGGRARVGGTNNTYGSNYGSTYGLDHSHTHDGLAIYEMVAEMFGTSAANRDSEKVFGSTKDENDVDVWSLRKPLKNIFIP